MIDFHTHILPHLDDGAKNTTMATAMLEAECKQGVTDVIRFRDLTAAYKDLTEDLPKADGDKNAPVYELLKRLDGECDV